MEPLQGLLNARLKLNQLVYPPFRSLSSRSANGKMLNTSPPKWQPQDHCRTMSWLRLEWLPFSVFRNGIQAEIQ